MQTVIVKSPISIPELQKMSEKMYQKIVKAVVDIEKEIMVVDAEMHCDQEHFLLESDSEQENLWGINLHPDKFGSDAFIEFDSMINIRPSWGNKSRGVDDPKIQQKIRAMVKRLVVP